MEFEARYRRSASDTMLDAVCSWNNYLPILKLDWVKNLIRDQSYFLTVIVYKVVFDTVTFYTVHFFPGNFL